MVRVEELGDVECCRAGWDSLLKSCCNLGQPAMPQNGRVETDGVAGVLHSRRAPNVRDGRRRRWKYIL